MFALLIIAVIILSGGFGFIRSLSFLAINTPFGTFEIGQTLIISLLIGIIFYNQKNEIRLNDKLLFPFYFFLLIIILQFLRNVSEGQSVRELIRNIKDGPFTFFIFYPLIYYINTESKLEKYIQWLMNIGIISAIVAIVQFIFKIQIDFSSTVELQSGFIRVYHPAALLFPLCIYIIISRMFDKQYKKLVFVDLISILILFFGMFSTLHRSLIISTLILVVIVIIYHSYSKKNIKVVFFLFLLSLFMIVYLITNKDLLDLLFNRLDSAYSEVRYFEGNYFGRYLIFVSTIAAVIKISILFGAGFTYGSNYSSSFSVTNDNTYANLFVISGLIGLLLYLFIGVFLIIKAYKLSLYVENGFYKILLFSISVYTVQWLLLGAFSDSITYGPHIIYLISSWAIYILINYHLSIKSSYAKKIPTNIYNHTVV